MEHGEVETNDDLEEIFQRLERTERLAKENNRILRGIRRSARLASFFQFLYWALIAASLVVAYYFLQPYIQELQNLIEIYRNGLGELQTS